MKYFLVERKWSLEKFVWWIRKWGWQTLRYFDRQFLFCRSYSNVAVTDCSDSLKRALVFSHLVSPATAAAILTGVVDSYLYVNLYCRSFLDKLFFQCLGWSFITRNLLANSAFGFRLVNFFKISTKLCCFPSRNEIILTVNKNSQNLYLNVYEIQRFTQSVNWTKYMKSNKIQNQQ